MSIIIKQRVLSTFKQKDLENMAAEPQNENPKIDRRIQRTKLALRQALLELTKEKGFEAVSVEEITERANLGRATFYLHYKDKEDLLLDEFREMASNRVEVLSEIPISIWKSNADNIELPDGRSSIMPLLLVFEHAAQNAELYRILLRGGHSHRIGVQIRQIIADSIHAIVQTRLQVEPSPPPMEVPIELLASYFSGALMGSLSWWLEQGTSPAPEEMARMFQHLFFPGVKKVMGLQKDNNKE
jgi:AcrR family transcriptional regulator